MRRWSTRLTGVTTSELVSLGRLTVLTLLAQVLRENNGHSHILAVPDERMLHALRQLMDTLVGNLLTFSQFRSLPLALRQGPRRNSLRRPERTSARPGTTDLSVNHNELCRERPLKILAVAKVFPRQGLFLSITLALWAAMDTSKRQSSKITSRKHQSWKGRIHYNRNRTIIIATASPTRAQAIVRNENENPSGDPLSVIRYRSRPPTLT